MRSFGIGQPVSRKEDPRFLTGRGRYVADLDLPRQGYAVFLFSRAGSSCPEHAGVPSSPR